ncbi:S16 family serine protease [Sutcliffiella sp. NPDC057660]|uniref:S16 family serine protease n=1 Tax=Sutcliffiella sp. NPDC057660 TaxID=3346199 RepID=UPI0036AD12EC
MKITLENKQQNLPFMATILFYLTELYLFLTGLISGIFFVNSLLLMIVIFLIILFIIRKTKVSKRALVFSTILCFLLLIYEAPLILFNENQYLVTSYKEPEELVKETGIYILSVNIDHLVNVENEKKIRAMYNYSQRVYEIIPITNLKFYIDKNTVIFEYIGLRKSEFEHSFENVTAYLSKSNSSIEEFFNRDNNIGGSAGLALVLSSFIEQGTFQNNIPITVTGAISKTGAVKKVGGIKEKTQIANESNFSYMIVPKENLTEANEVKETLNLSIKIFGVRNVDEAIQIINTLNNSKKKGISYHQKL